MKINKASLFSSAFLVLSLITVVGITSNPLKGVVFESYARVSGTANANRAERQALREGGDKWKVNGKQCAGSQCYQIALGKVKSDAQVKAEAQVVKVAQLTDEQAIQKGCEMEGGTYTNGTCYDKGVVPPVTPKAELNANDFAQVAMSNASNSQIAGVRNLCAASNSASACGSAIFLETFSLNVLRNLDNTSNKSIYNNAFNRFNSNQQSLKEIATNRINSSTPEVLRGVVANEQKFGAGVNSPVLTGVLGNEQKFGFAPPATIVVSATGPADCEIKANGKYFAYLDGSCTISASNLNGITAEQLKLLNSKAQEMTEAQCAESGRSGHQQVSWANGICTIGPITSNTALPTQKYIAPFSAGTGYYMSCINNNCPAGTRAVFNGSCACGFTLQPAGTSKTSPGLTYYAFAAGQATPEEKTTLQNECNYSLKINCDASTLQNYALSQLKATDANLYDKVGTSPVFYTSVVSVATPAPISQPIVQGGDCTANCPKSSVFTYKGTITGNSCTCSPTNALPLSAPASQSAEAGTYGQKDPSISDIVLPNGNTMGNQGCGVVAATNILNTIGGKNYTPQEVLKLIPESAWGPGGLSANQGDPLVKMLISQGLTYEEFKGEARAVWDHIEPGQVLFIGAEHMNGTVQSDVAHITYLIPTDKPNTFTLEKNDYFGSDMICTGVKKGKNDFFSCSNNKGQSVTIPVENQAVGFVGK